jgi:D-glycero-alpha-D-manno-heptose-7-phosphate kinase
MILTKTPYRIALSGGGTDLEYYYKKKNGRLFTLAIDQYAYVHLSSRSLDNNYFIQTSDTHFSKNLKNIKHKLIKETLKFYKIKDKVHVGTYSTVPTRTGLGTSSAILIGLINCILKYKNIKKTNKQIIKDAYKIERKICGYKGGWQDQTISQLGGLVRLDIDKSENLKFKKLKISKKLNRFISNHLVLVYTKEKRESSKIIKSQKKNYNIIDLYDGIKELNNELLSSFKELKVEKIANVFNKHWDIKKKLSKVITNHRLNLLYKKLMLEHKCLGGKLIGAGGGGFFLMVVKNKKKIIKSFKKSKISFLNLNPDNLGSRIIDTNKNNFHKI